MTVATGRLIVPDCPCQLLRPAVHHLNLHQQNAERLRAKIEETGDATGELTAQLVKEENEVAKNTERV